MDNLFENSTTVLDPTRPNPWMDPTHVHLWNKLLMPLSVSKKLTVLTLSFSVNHCQYT